MKRLWHTFWFDHHLYLVIGYNSKRNNFDCINLRDFNVADVNDLWEIVNTSEAQNMLIFYPLLLERKGKEWCDALHKEAFQVDWWQIEQLISPKQMAQFEAVRDTYKKLKQKELLDDAVITYNMVIPDQRATVEQVLYSQID